MRCYAVTALYSLYLSVFYLVQGVGGDIGSHITALRDTRNS